MKKILLSLFTTFAVVGITAGATRAGFCESAYVTRNTITTAGGNIDFSSLVNKPITASNLVPGESTPQSKLDVYNESNSTDVVVYMYATNVTGVACDKINLKVETGSYPEGIGNVKYNGSLSGITGESNRQLLTSNPPFAALSPNNTQVITQAAQLDSSADNSYQSQTCTWDEVFVAENI